MPVSCHRDPNTSSSPRICWLNEGDKADRKLKQCQNQGSRKIYRITYRYREMTSQNIQGTSGAELIYHSCRSGPQRLNSKANKQIIQFSWKGRGFLPALSIKHSSSSTPPGCSTSADQEEFPLPNRCGNSYAEVASKAFPDIFYQKKRRGASQIRRITATKKSFKFILPSDLFHVDA